MKIFITLAFTFCVSIFSFAQVNSQSEKMLYLTKSEKYRKMANTGGVLTVGGGILFIAGFVTLLNSSIETTSNGYGQSQTTTTGNPYGGLAMIILGEAGLGAGNHRCQ